MTIGLGYELHARPKTAAGVALTNALHLGTGQRPPFVSIESFPKILDIKTGNPSKLGFPHISPFVSQIFEYILHIGQNWDPVDSAYAGGGLLTRSARFNHSCLPNIQGTWADGCAEWRALRAIAPGEAPFWLRDDMEFR